MRKPNMQTALNITRRALSFAGTVIVMALVTSASFYGVRYTVYAAARMTPTNRLTAAVQAAAASVCVLDNNTGTAVTFDNLPARTIDALGGAHIDFAGFASQPGPAGPQGPIGPAGPTLAPMTTTLPVGTAAGLFQLLPPLVNGNAIFLGGGLIAEKGNQVDTASVIYGDDAACSVNQHELLPATITSFGSSGFYPRPAPVGKGLCVRVSGKATVSGGFSFSR